MFRQFSYRLIALIFGLIAGAPHRRGGSTRSEATDREYGTEADSGSGPHPGEDTDFDSEYDPPDRGDVPGWVLITLMTAGLVNPTIKPQTVNSGRPPAPIVNSR
ncbi:hypothetical protein [Brevibacterium oceani]|uniref:hypothetical protein n=1 Tax=Brevibacterium oceani TaxID=358099 RepID=UPI0015E6F4A0|nr:hypothetical protein [Brevibacterium oceani]